MGNLTRGESFNHFPLTATHLIGSVVAVVFVVALQRVVDALLSVCAPKLVQAALGARASFLVAARTAVQIAITFFLFWHAQIG